MTNRLAAEAALLSFWRCFFWCWGLRPRGTESGRSMVSNGCESTALQRVLSVSISAAARCDDFLEDVAQRTDVENGAHAAFTARGAFAQKSTRLARMPKTAVNLARRARRACRETRLRAQARNQFALETLQLEAPQS